MLNLFNLQLRIIANVCRRLLQPLQSLWIVSAELLTFQETDNELIASVTGNRATQCYLILDILFQDNWKVLFIGLTEYHNIKPVCVG